MTDKTGWTEPRAATMGFACCPPSCERRHAESLPAARQVRVLGAAGEQAVMTDALKAAWQHMAQKAPQEFGGGQRHGFADVAGGAVAIVEGHLAVGAGDQPRIADGDAV